MTLRRLAMLCVALTSLSFATLASARAPETAALGWVRLPGAESCPDAQALAKDIEARIGRGVFVSPSAADMLIEARVEHGAHGFHAVVHTTRPDGRDLGARELDSAAVDCSEIAEQLVLVIALTIDPDAELRPKDAPPPKPKTPKQECPEPRIDVIVQEKRVPVPVGDKAEPVTGEARVAATATLGLLPGVTPGVLVAGSVKPPGFLPIELALSAWPEREADVASGGARFTLLFAEVALCPVAPVGGPFDAHFCGGVGAGSMRARGFGFDQNEEQAKPIVMLGGRVRLSLRLGASSFLGAGAGLESPVVRPRFFFSDASGTEHDVHRVPPVGVTSEIGFGFSFGS